MTLKDRNDGDVIRIGGIVTNTKTIRTRKGDPMAFVTTEDLHGAVETTVFSSVYTEVSDLLTDDAPIIIEGSLQKDENSVKILAETIIPMNRAEELLTESVHIHLDVTKTDKTQLSELRTVFDKHAGACRAYIHLINPDSSETIIELSDSMRLNPGQAFQKDVNALIGSEVVKTTGKPVAKKQNGNNRNHKNNRFNG